jgi:hypothetical protein
MSPPDPNDPTTPYALERSTQPGTGSTDGILGTYYFQNAPGSGWGWFVSAQVQSAISTKDEYRPGNDVSVDLGTHVEVAQGLNLLLQLNGQHRRRDTGANANQLQRLRRAPQSWPELRHHATNPGLRLRSATHRAVHECRPERSRLRPTRHALVGYRRRDAALLNMPTRVNFK